MALTLVKEDGSGKVDANAYADVADADAYFEGHMYAAVWSGAAPAEKAVVLVMATRLIDALYQFNGFRAHDGQALQWPRERCPDPDKGLPTVSVLQWAPDTFVEPDLVPVPVVQATCEMARELLITDRTAAPAGEGIDSVQTRHTDAAAAGASGATDSSATKYNKRDTRPIISHVAQAMLSKFGGRVDGGGGTVRLVRA